MASNRRIALPQVWTLSPGEIIWEPAIAAVRFLALTGWRSGEALALRWSEIDLARRTATLADIKTDRRCGRFPTRRAACCMTSCGLGTAREMHWSFRQRAVPGA